MPTFVLLTTLTPQGLKTLRSTPERLVEVNRELELRGMTVTRQWALIGLYDMLTIIEAPDAPTLAAALIEVGSRGSALFEPLPVIALDD